MVKLQPFEYSLWMQAYCAALAASSFSAAGGNPNALGMLMRPATPERLAAEADQAIAQLRLRYKENAPDGE